MKRWIDPIELLTRRSHFLFGPRGTGKSFLIRHANGDRFDTIDLLRSDHYLELHRNPSLLESFISHDWVVIDEV
ncbi:MAG: ATP-binding protein, partial [Deltaproteobacteria bacterium]|nr:ATP-binding protein [Deltaproteobacteria bacterium]